MIFMRTKSTAPLFIALLFICLVPVQAGAQQAGEQAPPGKKLVQTLAAFEKYAEQAMKQWGTPGMAVAIVHKDKIIYSKAFGVKKIGEPDPVTTKTVFQVGSTTKAFTSALVAMMVDEGKVKWEDRVIDHLPDFRMYDPWVTEEFRVEDLLAQHSGLKAQAAGAFPFAGFNRKELLDVIRYIKPETSFRSRYAYVNWPFVHAAEIVEKHTGLAWEQNLKDRIFDPLEMKASSSTMEAYLNEPDRAALHRRINENPSADVIAVDEDWPYFGWVYTMGPAGSIGSNVLDMSNWLMMQMAGGEFKDKIIISKNQLEYTQTPKTIIHAPLRGKRSYYCLGWVYETHEPYPIVWHNGGTMGAKSIISFMPEAEIGIVVLSNLSSTLLPESLHLYFYDLYFGKEAEDYSTENLKTVMANETTLNKPAKPDPPMPLTSYEGDYSNEAYGRFTIRKKDDDLILTFEKNKIALNLSHWNRDIFLLSIPEYNDRMSFVRFHSDEDGSVDHVVVDFLDSGETGRFTRAR